MDLDRVSIGAELSKINFLLENLYALQLRGMGATHEQIPDLAEEMVRQANLPGTVYGTDHEDGATDAIRELSAHRIAMFFVGVQERLRSAGL